MFASEKADWKEKDLEGSGEGKERRDEIRVDEDWKSVYWGSAGAAVF